MEHLSLKTLALVGLTALTLSGTALVSAAPAQAQFRGGYTQVDGDDDFDTPRVQRRIIEDDEDVLPRARNRVVVEDDDEDRIVERRIVERRKDCCAWISSRLGVCCLSSAAAMHQNHQVIGLG